MASEKKHHIGFIIAHIHGLVQERCISIANTMELRLSCTNLSMWYHINDSLCQWCRKDFQGISSSCFWGLMSNANSSLRSLALCGTGELGSCSDWWGCRVLAINTPGPWFNIKKSSYPWWRPQMKTFSALLAICVGNSPVSGEFPAQRPVTWSFDVFFDLHLDGHLWGWWLEIPSCPLWRQSNAV